MIKADIEHIPAEVDNLMPQAATGSGSKGAFPPCIHQMARPAAGSHQHHVEADGQAGQVGVSGDEGRRSVFQPLTLRGDRAEFAASSVFRALTSTMATVPPRLATISISPWWQRQPCAKMR